MILTKPEINNIIFDNPQRSLVSDGCKYNKLLKMHLYGIELDSNIETLEGYESQELRNVRAKYSRSNKDLFSRLGRPIDKVFSAKGGSVYYNLSDAQDKKARSLSQDVRNGYSIRKWVEVFWKAHMLDDPFGIIFLEILPPQQAVKAKNIGRSFVYPTYKSITSVFDYLPKGSDLDYIVFNVADDEKVSAGYKKDDIIYRVVDDAFDYWVQKKDEGITIIEEQTFPNFFGAVPGMINSDLVNPSYDDYFLSLYDDAIELAKHFFLKGSIKITHEFLHGFPKYWEYADSCNDCKGTGLMLGKDCETCRGTGKSLMLKVSDAKLLSYPSSKDEPVVAPNVAGYVSPDKTYYEIATADLQLLEELMNITLWGSQSKVRTQGMSTDGSSQQTKTATEVIDDIKPEADRLKVISEMAEKRHKFILDNVIRLQVSPSYQGSSVNYGRRYMIEGPDAIWQKYSDARIKGVAISALDDLLLEYYEAKYASDPVKLAIQMKLMKVEPFVHYKVADVKGFNPAEDDYKAKMYFGEWLSLQSEAIILSTDVIALRESLVEYCKTKLLPQQIDPLAA